MKEMPLVSIGLPIFNAERTLPKAINSVMNQTYKNWELLVVDDGSTDRSLEVAQSFRDDRIQIIPSGERRGIATRLNQLIEASRGKYFARMDGDDLSFPRRIERQVSYLESHPEIDLLGTAVIVFRDDGGVIGRLPVNEFHVAICANPWSGFYLPHPTWMGKRAWFAHHGYDDRANGAEDQHLLFRTYMESQFACLPEVLLGYREDSRSLKRMLTRRYIFLKTLLRCAVESKTYNIALKLAVTQVAKIVGDILNLGLGIKSMRNRLLTVDYPTREIWAETWRKSDTTNMSLP